MLGNEKCAHDLSIAYLLYREISEEPVTQDVFFDEYENAVLLFLESLKNRPAHP